MKRIVSAFCMLAILLGMIVPSAFAETSCSCCGATDVTWETLTASTTLQSGHHYRLESNLNRGQSIISASNFTVCIDLNGKTLSNSSGRLFLVGYNSGKNNTVNIMDSSAAQTGKMVGGFSGSGSGGVVYLYGYNTMNIYGGTVSNSANKGVNMGGVFQLFGNKATLNMYGGKIIGGIANNLGGAVSLHSEGAALNMYGGSIEGGKAPSGRCVYAEKDAKVKLSNDASVEELFIAGTAATTLTISGTYTGSLAVRGTSPYTLGSQIGVSDNADVSGARITTVNQQRYGAVVSGTKIVLDEFSYCEACKRNVYWEKVDNAAVQALTDAKKAFAPGHYCLTEDISTSQMILTQDGNVCIDLAGHTYASTGRAFLLGKDSGACDVSLNIQDSSAAGTGRVEGANVWGSGGVMFMYSGTTLNIYGGTVTNTSTSDTIVNYGGVVYLRAKATLNLYGGTIVGAKANYGGAICLVDGTDTLNVAGGSIVGGMASSGNCVFVAKNATVELSGNGSVEQLYFAGSAAEKLTVVGDYTGKVSLKFATVPAVGTDIGNCVDAKFLRENITIDGMSGCAAISGENMVVAEQTDVSVTDSDGNVTYYDTLAAAAAVAQNGETIKLLADNSEDVTIKNATLDLAGWDLMGNVVGDGLLIKDSVTDDFTVEEGEQGLITGTVTGEVTAAEGYLALAETSGISYHRYVLQIDKVNLRPGATGIYYTATIRAGEKLQSVTERFGLAVGVKNNPTADENTTGKYTAYGKEDYANGVAKSVLISAVMKTENDSGENTVRATTNVYGRPYILYTDATGSHYLYGEAYVTNLQTLTETIDSLAWENMRYVQAKALSEMYDAYKDEVSTWELPSVQKKAKASEDNTLKVLLLGNSHGLDSTHLLYEIFKAEGYITGEQKVVLGAMYISGCKVARHVSNLTYDAPGYNYYKNDGSNSDGTWNLRKYTTIGYALQDEDWDIVLLQEMNTTSAYSDATDQFMFGNTNIETVFAYASQKLGYMPKIMWNMVWANPEIPEDYVKFAMGEETGSDDYVEGTTPGAATDPASKTWIFKDTMLSSRISWTQDYVNYWQNDRATMYDCIVQNVQKYVIGNPRLGLLEEDVMAGATAVEYALTQCGVIEDGGTVTGGVASGGIYRDYTHISDFGRVLVAYLWYAKLTGKTEITEVNYTTISAALRATAKYQKLGDLTLTDEQIAAIIASVNYTLQNPYCMPNS